jgi:hypothetical protein
VEYYGGRAVGDGDILFTDVEGSTRLWESEPSVMGPAMAHHDGLVREAVEAQGRLVFSTGGMGSPGLVTLSRRR